MKADQQIRFVVVGEGRAAIDRDGLVPLPRQQDAEADAAFNRRFQSPRDLQRQIFFLGARPVRARRRRLRRARDRSRRF